MHSQYSFSCAPNLAYNFLHFAVFPFGIIFLLPEGLLLACFFHVGCLIVCLVFDDPEIYIALLLNTGWQIFFFTSYLYHSIIFCLVSFLLKIHFFSFMIVPLKIKHPSFRILFVIYFLPLAFSFYCNVCWVWFFFSLLCLQFGTSLESMASIFINWAIFDVYS